MAKRRRPQASSKGPDSEKAAAKRTRREERKAREEAARRRQALRKRVRNWSLAAVVVAAAALVVFFLARTAFPGELEGVLRPSNEGRGHVTGDQEPAYATATPTSGVHSPGAPRCGVFSQELPLGAAVHALEHGVVVIWYRPDLRDELLPGLRGVAAEFDSHVIVAANSGLTDEIVATAWNRLKAYDDVEPELSEFVATYRNRGPEKVNCDLT